MTIITLVPLAAVVIVLYVAITYLANRAYMSPSEVLCKICIACCGVGVFLYGLLKLVGF